MELIEKTISSRTLYKGRILNLKVDEVTLPNGGTSVREVIAHGGAAAVAAGAAAVCMRRKKSKNK